MLDMAKRKNKPKKVDRHKSPFMVRLPELLRDRFQRLARQTERTVTKEIVLACREYLARHGLWSDDDLAASGS